MRKLLLFVLLLLPFAVRAQQTSGVFQNPVGGNVVASTTNCSVQQSCVWQKLSANAGTTVVTLAGTFSATVLIEQSGDGGNTWTTAATLSAVGVTSYPTNGFSDIRARCSAFVSGTVNVTISTGLNQVQSTAAGGGQNSLGTAGPNPQFGSWTVGITGSTVYARNNSTGNIDYSGTDSAVVLNALITANATTGGHLFFKNGVYPIASATQETLSGCSNFYGIGIPGNALGSWVQWIFEGESRPSWPGEEVPTSIQTNGVIFNVTSAAITAAGSSFLAAFWQRPLSGGSGCALPISVDSNELYFKNLGVRFPTNTRGNTGGIIPWAALTVDYENVLADFNMTYGAIDTGPAPVAGTTGSFGLATTYSGNGNLQHFKDTYAVGYDTCYDINSEHAVMDTSTAIYCNYPAQFGRVTSPGIFHPIVLTKFSDQENLNGFKLGPGMLQGSRIDMFGLDLELGAVGKWYARTVGAMTETNPGYTSGLITYITVQQNSGIVAELPGANLFNSGGQGFQFIEGTHSPNLAINPVTDTFTRPNSTASSHTNGLGPAWLSGTQTGNFNLTIASNAAQVNATGASTGYSFYVAQPFNGDQFSKWTCASFDASASTFCEVATNGVSTPNVQTYYAYYCSHVAAGGSGILKNVAAVSTTLASQTSAVGCNAGDTIELRHIGTTLWAYRNGNLDTSFTNPVIDASISGGSPGAILSQDATAAVTGTNWFGGSMPGLHGTDSIYSNPTYHTTYNTVTNCSSSASPAVCGSAAAGSFVIAAAATTVTVNTTAVTANSTIIPIEDDSLGTKLGVTCNTATSVPEPNISTRVAGTSFTVLVTVAPVTNPKCYSYFIVN